MRYVNSLVFCLLAGLMLALIACEPSQQTNNETIRGEIVVDGGRQTFVRNQPVSVQELLRLENIQLDTLDRVSPSLFTQIRDGMTITIVRVTQTSVCEDQVIEFEQKRFPRSDLPPGEERIIEQGENGLAQVCFNITYEDGVETTRNRQRDIPIREPKDQIVYYGVSDVLEPVALEGTLAYISAGQAWVMRSSNTARRPIPLDGQLDGRVFALAPGGRMLLYTRLTPNETDPGFSNELWLLPDINGGEPIQLQQIDILAAQWMPDRPNTFSYTSASAGGGFQGWSAYNDLWQVEIDPRNGAILTIDLIIDQNLSGQFASWGTHFSWSPDGQNVAYAKSDGVGLVNQVEKGFGPYRLAYPYFNAAVTNEWVWQPEISWSPDGRWFITTVHGAPYGSEAPIDSVVFDVAIVDTDPNRETPLTIPNFIRRAGIWAKPQFSPERADNTDRIAYLQARTPLNSVGTDYDLVVMDRDGSNKSVIFPPRNMPGLRPFVNFDGEFRWSPSGRQIAIIYQGNLWLVDADSGLAQQLTNEGQITALQWVE